MTDLAVLSPRVKKQQWTRNTDNTCPTLCKSKTPALRIRNPIRIQSVWKCRQLFRPDSCKTPNPFSLLCVITHVLLAVDGYWWNNHYSTPEGLKRVLKIHGLEPTGADKYLICDLEQVTASVGPSGPHLPNWYSSSCCQLRSHVLWSDNNKLLWLSSLRLPSALAQNSSPGNSVKKPLHLQFKLYKA